jgi:hypothetical protein
MGLELEMGLKFFFLKKFETNYHFFSSYVLLRCSFTYDVQRTFVALQFVHPMRQKLFNLVKKLEKCYKLFDDRYMLNCNGWFYTIAKKEKLKVLNQVFFEIFQWPKFVQNSRKKLQISILGSTQVAKNIEACYFYKKISRIDFFGESVFIV